MKLSQLRQHTLQKLLQHSDTPQLDADLLLMHHLKKTRAELLLSLNDEYHESSILNNLIERRINGEPIAYILGFQPFWTMDLIVTPDTLIPRPETECMIDWILSHYSDKTNLRIADLGTGTGAIAIALAIECGNQLPVTGYRLPTIDATDISYEALTVAKKNIEKYKLNNIALFQGDWCNALPDKKYDIIISNPPYIAAQDSHLEKLQYEPQTALVSGTDGLDAIRKITSTVKNYLNPDGVLIIEHGFDQADKVAAIFKSNGFDKIENHKDLSQHFRFTTGYKK